MKARVLAGLLLLVSAASAGAQHVRVTSSTVIRYIELRPLVRDSVTADTTSGAGLLHQLPDGRVVRCIPGEAFCYDTRAGTRVSTVPAITDLEASAWGFGRGVRLFAQLRGRTGWGSAPELWPRGDDALELLAAYVEVERERFRVRGGRQWTVSGLGFYNFDGVSATVRPHATAALEGYVGRSLLRGLNEPRTSSVLESIEALTPPSPGLLAGLQARYRRGSELSVGATYQVDFRTDGAGLYSELLAADGVVRMGDGSLDGAVELDVATGVLNEARLHLRLAPLGRVAPFAELRHYQPYFELWTIWGAFSPVGFDEATAGATWVTASGAVLVRAIASYRRYGDARADLELDPLRNTGWSLGTSANWSLSPHWNVDAAYRVETGAGSARRDGYVGVQRGLGETGSVALQAVAFQRLYEFRLSEGVVFGLGAEAWLRLSERARIFGSTAAYRHFGAGSLPTIDWTQRRASVRVLWTLGAEPWSTS